MTESRICTAGGIVKQANLLGGQAAFVDGDVIQRATELISAVNAVADGHKVARRAGAGRSHQDAVDVVSGRVVRADQRQMVPAVVNVRHTVHTVAAAHECPAISIPDSNLVVARKDGSL